MKYFFSIVIYIPFFLAIYVNKSYAQQINDTNSFKLDYYTGQKILLEKNLDVLINYYNIDLAKADLIQAKLWNNPHFVWNGDLYSVGTNTYMNNQLQRLIQIEYTFSIAGKHTNSVKLEKINVELSEYQFTNFLRGLIYEYNVSFNNLEALRSKIALYDLVISDFNTLIKASEKQYTLGLISLNDLIRLKSELLTIQSEYATILNQIQDEQMNMRLFLNYTGEKEIYPISRISYVNLDLSYQDFLYSALENRPDLKIAEKSIDYHKKNHQLQISTAVPDIKIGYQPHDRGSNYQRPYAGIVLEWDVPLLNRNQGAIKSAKIMIDISKKGYEYKKIEIESEVLSAYSQYQNSLKIYRNFTEEMMKDIEKLSKAAGENFTKKNISLLQYIDYQRTFIDTRVLYIDNKNNFLNSVSYINFISGKELIK